jgi:hypothetical protein
LTGDPTEAPPRPEPLFNVAVAVAAGAPAYAFAERAA